jgi:ribosomal protein L16 Arg81 hydroxylase
MDFADLIAPLREDEFLRTYWNKRPLHLPAPAHTVRDRLIGWERLNELLGVRAHWTDRHIKLVLNSRQVMADFYMDDVPQSGGGTVRLADPAKVETFLAMGASLVADQIEDAAPEIRALTAALSRRFAARVNANLYASFKGVQAFASHCDLHEVFAVHCHGEKRWRIYANRADNPLEPLEGADAQAQIDAAKGPVLMDVTLKPGDVLYIPRGFFHDAMASARESLHLTIGLAPPSGRLLFGLLEQAAIADPAFRAYLADARNDGGAPLAAQIADLMERLQHIAAQPAFREDVQRAQARLAGPAHRLTLPARPALASYARSDRPAIVERRPNGTVLRHTGGEVAIGLLGDVAAYLLERPAVSTQELAANFPHHHHEAIVGLVATAERLGLVRRYQPQL